MRTILILCSLFFIHSPAQAQFTDDSAAYQGAIDGRNAFVTALENKDYVSFAHHAFDAAIRRFAEQLRTEQQDQELADRLISQWETSSARFPMLVASGLEDLGDHAPLFAWINTYLDQVGAKYGAIILNLPIVKNIQMLNYSIPVVFRPHGSWQTDGASQGLDLRIEYRKHFIPFANIVTYYAALLGCEYAVNHNGQPQLKKICKPAAQKLEFVMGRYIAPVVSDWIFKASNQSLQVDASRLKYNNVDDLRRAVQSTLN